jgi:chitodextrinase
MGQPVYLSAADTVSLADGSTVAMAAAIGVAVATPDGGTSATSGEMVDVVMAGPVAGYTTNMVFGTYYYIDNDAGVIADAAGTKSTILGIGLSSSVLLVRITPVGLS